jgi:hypothetical protein
MDGARLPLFGLFGLAAMPHKVLKPLTKLALGLWLSKGESYASIS